MPTSPHQETPLTLLFVLRLWREHAGAPWRAALRAADGAPVGFADLEQLAAFLLRLADIHDPCGGADQRERTTDGGKRDQRSDNA